MLRQICQIVHLKSIKKKSCWGWGSIVEAGFFMAWKNVMLFFDYKVKLLYVCAKIIHSETVNNRNIREAKSAVHTV